MSRNSLRYDGRSRPGTGLVRALGAVLLLSMFLAGPAQAVYMHMQPVFLRFFHGPDAVEQKVGGNNAP